LPYVSSIYTFLFEQKKTTTFHNDQHNKMVLQQPDWTERQHNNSFLQRDSPTIPASFIISLVRTMTSGRFDTGTHTSVEYGCKNIKTSYPEHLLQFL
jgi:hypothetical protein